MTSLPRNSRLDSVVSHSASDLDSSRRFQTFITSVRATLKRAYDEVLKIWATELIEFKHNQQDATLYSGIYCYECSTRFRRFLHPTSGAQNCIHSIGYLSSFFCFLLLSWVISSSLTIAVRNTRCCVHSFELLMMGGGTAETCRSFSVINTNV